jgi:hypothetical protein
MTSNTLWLGVRGGLALIATIIALFPLRCGAVPRADASGGVPVPHFGHGKRETCAQRGHDRIRALMQGGERPRPVATYRTCQ